MELIVPPRIEYRPERSYVGIRIITPFNGMLRLRDELLEELHLWTVENGVPTHGYGFLRLHVIDMKGPMDLEVGLLAADLCDGDERVRAAVLPAGDYATLTYRDHARRANGALIDWARDNGVDFDRHDVPSGDAFACRYEAYLTDPKLERRKTKWNVELSIKIGS